MTLITCGKFDNKIDLSSAKNMDAIKKRLWARSPNKLKSVSYTPLATNGPVVLCNGSRYRCSDFFSNISKSWGPKFIVLTWREHDLLIKNSIDHHVSIDISVLEDKYPIFPAVKYRDDLMQSYLFLENCLKKVNGLGLNCGSLAKHFFVANQHKIERKIRYKSSLDAYFGFAYFSGYQEVFKLFEERKDRAVLALDFNSMYADCLKGEFPCPKSLRYISGDEINQSLEELEKGIYRVILKNCNDDFFKKFHPFKYVKLNNSMAFDLDDSHCLEVLLHRDELLAYKKYFEEIKVLEGIISNKTVEHPLRRRVIDSYRKRLNAKEHSRDYIANFHKLFLSMAHSVTNPVRYKTSHFCSDADLIEYANSNYMLNEEENNNEKGLIANLLRHRYFNLSESDDRKSFRAIDFHNSECIYSISSQVTSNARLKLLAVLERFYHQKNVEICYSNIDSIHVSIRKKDLSLFLEQNGDLFSDLMGDMRIQAIGDKGYWLDIGRYWIFKGKHVSLHKNKVFNHPGSTDPFIGTRKLAFRFKQNFFDYIVERYISIGQTFSYDKKLLPVLNGFRDFKRFGIEDLTSLLHMESARTLEEEKSRREKISLFCRLKSQTSN